MDGRWLENTEMKFCRSSDAAGRERFKCNQPNQSHDIIMQCIMHSRQEEVIYNLRKFYLIN